MSGGGSNEGRPSALVAGTTSSAAASGDEGASAVGESADEKETSHAFDGGENATAARGSSSAGTGGAATDEVLERACSVIMDLSTYPMSFVITC